MLDARVSHHLAPISLLTRRSIFSLLQKQTTPIKPYCTYHPSKPSYESLLDSIDHLLQQCKALQHCNQIQTHFIVLGIHESAFLASRFVSLYSRFGRLCYAQKVFDKFSGEKSLLLWNSVLRANVTHQFYEKAVALYVRMVKDEVFGDRFSLPLIIRACGYLGCLSLCNVVHGRIVEMGFESHVHVGNELIGMYRKLGRMGDACKVFDEMGVRNYISWNMMVSGYALNCECDKAVQIFRRMECEGFEPNVVTWTSLLSSHARCGRFVETVELFSLMRRSVEVNAEALAVVASACANSGAFERGKMIHGYVVQGGFEDYTFVKNALICVYGKCGETRNASNLFLEVKDKNLVSWNALITSYADAGLCDDALDAFSQLERSRERVTLRPNVVSWSAVIDGFALAGRCEESLGLFRKMQLSNINANAVTLSGVLSVCAELAALSLGREIHAHVTRAAMDNNILVENGLLNMYTKCGSLKKGYRVFKNIQNKDTVSWNSMISGYGIHGQGASALDTYELMIKSGFKPDGVTFIAVLSACSHAGLVSEGRKLFDQMVQVYKITPLMEHYACMVDLLGRAGLLQKASEIIDSMPMEPNAYVWGALLNACRKHKNTLVAEETASHVLSLKPDTTGNFMLLSNIYAANGRWEDSALVRASARMNGLKKNAGQSWIEVKSKVHMFTAGNNVRKGLEEVYWVLQELVLQMESEKPVADRRDHPTGI